MNSIDAAGRETTPQTRRPRRYAWIWSGVWLFFLFTPLTEAWNDQRPLRRYGGIVIVLLFAAVFVIAFDRIRTPQQHTRQAPRYARITLLATATVLIVAGVAVIGPHALGMAVYVCVMSMFLLPTAAAWTVTVSLAIACGLVALLVPGWLAEADLSMPVQMLVAALAAWGMSLVFKRNAQLAAAQQEIARLAVVDERNRFARDLHDILGHSLTVVAIKAELAGRMAEADPKRAREEIAEVERLARQALADVRAAVGGYREVSLAGEVASARTALAAAGIDARLPSAVDHVPARQRELFGWVVREGVTNVVRHSGATHCAVEVGTDWVEVSDDGRGPTPPDAAPTGHAPGHGLAGLRERVTAGGGTLSAGRGPDGGFVLRADVS